MQHIPEPLQRRIQEFVDVRRDLHAHPELGLKEIRTSDMIAAKLSRWG